ncbi:fatty acid desaturase family protein [Rhodopirellula sp. SWK7]|uniref:fatty acid desaturase family protein n=1 Tax=Rhodopirellula sp. SWK7 TaxID=595460 RepID=UPI0002BED078|nr:fatty acid desaturase family protein [Rhodopirellula sp. SWK7]EMI46415.1 fatty acid desaturase family protein [Rhodopirellula sp. SWK7]
MRTVDQILQEAASQNNPTDAEPKRQLDRFSRKRHVELVRSLSQVSGVRSTLYIGLQWAIMIGTMIIAARVNHWAVYLGAMVVLASRMQALGVLMHDGAHYLLYKNRLVNDVVSDLFVAFPIGMSTTLYRKTHFRHHRYTNTDEDQDLAAQEEEHEWFEWPKTRLGLFWTLFRSVFGMNFLRGWILYKHWAPWNNFRSPDFPPRCRVLYVLSTVCVYGFFAFALKVDARTTLILIGVYMFAGMTLLNLINRIRATAEHLGTRGDHELNDTRTVLPNLIERMLIAPYGVNYHLEHHLFPSVPGYQLSKLHRELMQDDEFRERAHITKGYTGVIQELMQSQREANEADAEKVDTEKVVAN